MSTRATLLLAAVVACHRPDANVTPAPQASAPAIVASVTPAAEADASAVRPTVDAWNAAHAQRGAAAFEALYAARVRFYGTELTGAEAAKRKAAALAAAPDYQQTVEALSYSLGDAHDTWVQFAKTTKQKGKTGYYRMLLIVDATEHITEESDDVTSEPQWCTRLVDQPDWMGSGGYGDPHTRDNARPPSQQRLLTDRAPWPFTVGAAAAADAALHSSHAATLPATATLSASDMLCAKRCAKADATCGYHFPIERKDGTREWVYVDPITKRLAWESYDPAGSAVLAFESL